MGWSIFGRSGGPFMNATELAADVVTGGQPTAAQLEALAAQGYRTIVDTRHPAEPRGFDEPALVKRLGLSYVSIPMVGPVPDADFDRLRQVLGRPDRRPAVLHCASGNRVSGLMIPWLILDEGRTPDEALHLASRAGLRNGYLAQLALDYVRRRGGESGESRAVNG